MFINNLVPAIDLMGGKVVQLKKGEEKKFESEDLDYWIEQFKEYSRVHVIDLDGAFGNGHNIDLIKKIAAELPIHVGGGIRSVADAKSILELGVEQVIFGSSLYVQNGINKNLIEEATEKLGKSKIIAGIDCKDNQIAIKGWREKVDLTALDAINHLDEYVDAFLYTNVDIEGTQSGIETDYISELNEATSNTLYAAGGIADLDDIQALEKINVRAVSGMAIYLGHLLD
jgi:phosphoribosylformimino-5-aminoimidazole carboxamide ribotide isomerase